MINETNTKTRRDSTKQTQTQYNKYRGQQLAEREKLRNSARAQHVMYPLTFTMNLRFYYWNRRVRVHSSTSRVRTVVHFKES